MRCLPIVALIAIACTDSPSSERIDVQVLALAGRSTDVVVASEGFDEIRELRDLWRSHQILREEAPQVEEKCNEYLTAIGERP
jgi:hypothetical protein